MIGHHLLHHVGQYRIGAAEGDHGELGEEEADLGQQPAGRHGPEGGQPATSQIADQSATVRAVPRAETGGGAASGGAFAMKSAPIRPATPAR